MEVFETGKNNQQSASKAEPICSGDGFTPRELYKKGREKYNAGDFSDALVWFEKAAKQGNERAQIYCAEMYYKGEGTEEDKAKALVWYEKAAEKGPARYAQCACGDMYYKGEGTAEDKAKALMWYEKAAEKGDVWAQLRCSDMYNKGEGTAQDWKKALMWYEKALEPSSAPLVPKRYMTRSHYEELQKELDYCKTTRTAEVKKMVDEARSLGDFAENAEYHAAKEEERCLRSHIEDIEKILQQAFTINRSAAAGEVL